MTTAAKHETTSTPPGVLIQTRIRGIAPENANAIGLQSSESSTLRWGCLQIYDRTPVDSLVGLDYFGARYFSAAQGRFTSPDWSETPQAIPYASLEDPQTLNLYSYVSNNPLARNDPDGHVEAMTFSNRRANGYSGPIRATPNEERFVGGAFKLALGIGLTGTAAVGNPSSVTGTLLVLNSVISAASMLASGVTRMTGGGFGGSTINLVDSAKAEEFSIALRHAYERRTGIAPQVIVTRASQGVQACLI